MNVRPEASSLDSPTTTGDGKSRAGTQASGPAPKQRSAEQLSSDTAACDSGERLKLNRAIRTRPDDAQSGAFPLLDRRLGLDRRDMPGAEAANGGEEETGLERRRGAGRRRTDFLKAADEGELTPEQFMFLMAIDAFKKSNERMYPTWSDVLEVIRLMGYRKTMPSELNLRNAEDWREGASTPSGVKNKHGKEAKRAAA
ncbi:MAG: hypothetical protein H7210_04095 [Pyrinomonadaceae bacterium]|nr:hypothetical protein [Phycisphaerales bacterium]